MYMIRWMCLGIIVACKYTLMGFGKGPTYTAVTMTELLFCSTWKLVEYHVYFVHFLMVAAVCRISGLFCSFFLVAAVKFGGIATFL